MGVFQLESAGITNVVTGLRPQSIEDITAVVALYRPGPVSYTHLDVYKRQGSAKINCTKRLIRRCRALQRAKELRNTGMLRLRRLSGLCSSCLLYTSRCV